jgi:hypothetical protein
MMVVWLECSMVALMVAKTADLWVAMKVACSAVWLDCSMAASMVAKTVDLKAG